MMANFSPDWNLLSSATAIFTDLAWLKTQSPRIPKFPFRHGWNFNPITRLLLGFLFHFFKVRLPRLKFPVRAEFQLRLELRQHHYQRMCFGRQFEIRLVIVHHGSANLNLPPHTWSLDTSSLLSWGRLPRIKPASHETNDRILQNKPCTRLVYII